MTETADNKLLASVFEILGRAVSEDLTAPTPEEAALGYLARLRTLSRLLGCFTPHFTAAHEFGDVCMAVRPVSDALEGISTATDASFWLAIEDASDAALMSIAFALEGSAKSGSTSEPSPLDIALEFLATPGGRQSVPVTGLT